jgi:hypothetical protein
MALRPPVEAIHTAMKFGACADDPASIDEIWRTQHDVLIATFPRDRRRGPVKSRVYRAEHALGFLEDLEEMDALPPNRDDLAIEYAELRTAVARLGMLVVVMVDVVMDES